jgi:energy-coupling factor transporter ATP-binding protein EcfA2
VATPGERALAQLEKIASSVESRFREGRRVLSFQEYLDLFAAHPVRHARDAARYLRDMFDFYGTAQIERPWGTLTRFRLFDLPWETEGNRRDALVGQEEVQNELYRILSNFAQEGRPNKLILLHGPNGSSKSTLAACLMRALEHYSSTDEGALYRFHWVFPSQKTVRGSIGFGGPRAAGSLSGSYAHLDEDQIDARLFIEIRDHPLFLLPLQLRRQLLDDIYPKGDRTQRPPDWLLRGRLSHKSQQVYEALLASYRGRWPRSSATCKSSDISSPSAIGWGRSPSARRCRSMPASARSRPTARWQLCRRRSRRQRSSKHMESSSRQPAGCSSSATS